MKKGIVWTIMVLICWSCSEKPQAKPDEILPEPSEVAPNTAIAKEDTWGLIQDAGCLACHKKEGKLVGPSFQEIAEKYTEADVDHLATKIIEGGNGVWGQVPMSPHQQLSHENAQKMVKYILTLKK